MEQIEETMEVTYDGKVKTLWNRRLSHKECAGSLQAMQNVVQDTLDRLTVEWGSQDLYMAFEAMDLRAWRALTRSPEQLSLEQQATLLDLRMKTKRLLRACGLQTSFPGWLEAVDAVQDMWTDELREKTDNRILWAKSLTAPVASQELQDLLHSLRPLIFFYLAFMDGTGDVERLLGRHSGFLAVHRGESDIAEACLEVAVWSDTIAAASQESDEAMLFKKTEDGTLQFTDFSRRCAALWISLHGRRFTCYKIRKDKGCQRATRTQGTHQAVKAAQAAAMKQLMTLSASDSTQETITGHNRAELAQTARSRPPLQASKAILAFRRKTAEKRAERGEVPVWTGIWKKALTKRCAHGVTRAPAASQGPVARQQQARPKREAATKPPPTSSPEAGPVARQQQARPKRKRKAEAMLGRSRDCLPPHELQQSRRASKGFAADSAASSSCTPSRQTPPPCTKAPQRCLSQDGSPPHRGEPTDVTRGIGIGAGRAAKPMSKVTPKTKPARQSFGRLLEKVLKHKARSAKPRAGLPAASREAAASLPWAEQGDSWKSLGRAAVVRVQSVDDLDRAKVSGRSLQAWLSAIVWGKAVQDKSRTLQFASVKNRPVQVNLSRDFVRKHHRLTGAIQDVIASTAWNSCESGGHRVDSLENLTSLLRSVQRKSLSPAASLGSAQAPRLRT